MLQCVIKKENNFKQAGDRYRSWAPDRQDRFVKRWVEILSEPRLTHEIRGIWISYWSQVRTKKTLGQISTSFLPSFSKLKHYLSLCISQADRSLGQKLASRLNVRPSI